MSKYMKIGYENMKGKNRPRDKVFNLCTTNPTNLYTKFISVKIKHAHRQE